MEISGTTQKKKRTKPKGAGYESTVGKNAAHNLAPKAISIHDKGVMEKIETKIYIIIIIK